MGFKRLKVLFLVTLLILSLCCCSDSTIKNDTVANRQRISLTSGNNTGEAVLYDNKKSINENVHTYISKMSLEEKVGQMILVEKDYLTDQDVRKYFIGSVFSAGGSAPRENNPENWRKMIRKYKDAARQTQLSIPLIFGTDAVHGNNNMQDTVIYPHNIGLGATHNGELTAKIASAVADELNAIGVDWTFSPCVAVSNDIRWGREYECFSENPDLVTIMSAPFITALQDKGIITCAKHYVADGAVQFGTGTNGYLIDRGNVNISFTDLLTKYISVYKESVLAGVKTIMVSYSSIKNKKNHLNKDLIQYTLKEEIGFSGVVVSDYEGVEYLDGNGMYPKVVAAVNAGIDMLMEGRHWKECYDSILEAVWDGNIDGGRIDDAVSRILRLKMETGKFDEKDKTNPYYELRNSTNIQIAEEAVRNSLVLLKNQNNVLPLRKSAKVAVIGPAADNIGAQCGGWTRTWQGGLDMGNSRWMSGTTILDGFREMAGKGGGLIITDPAQVKKADVIVAVLGEHPYAEGKGDDKTLGLSEGLAFKENEKTLETAYGAKKPVVVILLTGRPRIVTDQINKWNALVEAWLPGTEGDAVAPVLYGDKEYNFTGRLPVSWPKSVKQLPLTTENLNDANVYDALFQYGFQLNYSD
ncbi:MAG TPA: glycoside hydrolase family 3 N-terminal domain-containing protein [Ruminiclostridium sp.]|nr:glycoside hydrolase family 3 N-terminal domain-containing protein [Ruminiclostridium sp.]